VPEWCWDGYDFGYYASSPGTDPTGPAADEYRVLRGGSWSSDALHARCADRDGSELDSAGNSLGFRCARGP
jgi:formylglycine-generating enzyme required for sulfatase activity